GEWDSQFRPAESADFVRFVLCGAPADEWIWGGGWVLPRVGPVRCGPSQAVTALQLSLLSLL
ncbi:MAG: hypothetical protein ACK5YO_34145, partial [Planctomyces sp.]